MLLLSRLDEIGDWLGVVKLRIAQLLLASLAIICALSLRISTLRQFPGPVGWPIVGNLPSIYHKHAEKQFFKWATLHGDVIRVQLGTMTILVVNSASAAKQIFTASASALSSRPIFHTFHKIIAGTLGPTIGTEVYGDALKRGRKATAAELSKPAVKANLGSIDLETRHFLYEVKLYGIDGQHSLEVSKLVKRLTLSLTLSICFGRRMYLGDPLTQEIIHVEDQILRLRSMTDNLQDYLPFLRIWPFNKYHQKAVQLRERRDAYFSILIQDIRGRISSNTNEECLYSKNLAKPHPLPIEELSTVLLTFLSGGLATLSNTIHWSLYRLATDQGLQETAYKSIRQVYPNDEQLFKAGLDDIEEIPYISALVRESLRYYTPSRLGLPRLAVHSFQYGDKTIPEGTTVLLNTFACNMDVTMYGDPENFRPERWLDDPDLPIFSYGLGYRMCAGYALANRVIYTLLARLIATFAIGASLEVDANHITGCGEPAHQAMAPKPCGLYFRPRDAKKLKELLWHGNFV